MHTKLLLLFALVSVARNHDVSIGSDGGRLLFEDTRFASPAIWRQVENITVIAPNNEVISKVNITDMRADKDGDVDIVSGGEGEKSVTIEIKSPTVLRGYEFHITVFSVPESNYKKSENSDKTGDLPEDILNNEYETTSVPQNSNSESSETNRDIPTSIANDSDVLRPGRQTNGESDIPELPEESETIITSTETSYTESRTTENYQTTIDTEENNDGTTDSVEGSGSDENPAPVIPSDWLRPARGTDSENDLTETPVENEDTITTTETLNKDTTEGSLKSNDGDSTVSTPNSYVDTKDIPDYSALSILDYIKNKEQGNRQIRRTEEKLDTSDTQSSDEEQNNGDEGSSPPTEDYNITTESDDTVDLVPPEVDAPYNDNFTPDLESTEGPLESSTSSTHSRSARRYELPDEYYALIAKEAMSTPMTEDATTESSLEEKSRNSRNTEDNPENSNNFNLTIEPSADPNIVATNDNISSGIVLLKEDRVIITANSKQVEFTLPIVLVIGNENNFPIFKLIGDSTDTQKDLEDSESGLYAAPDVTMDYEARDAAKDASDLGRDDEYSY